MKNQKKFVKGQDYNPRSSDFGQLTYQIDNYQDPKFGLRNDNATHKKNIITNANKKGHGDEVLFSKPKYLGSPSQKNIGMPEEQTGPVNPYASDEFKDKYYDAEKDTRPAWKIAPVKTDSKVPYYTPYEGTDKIRERPRMQKKTEFGRKNPQMAMPKKYFSEFGHTHEQYRTVEQILQHDCYLDYKNDRKGRTCIGMNTEKPTFGTDKEIYGTGGPQFKIGDYVNNNMKRKRCAKEARDMSADSPKKKGKKSLYDMNIGDICRRFPEFTPKIGKDQPQAYF